jgi:transposase-like protein
MTSTASGESFGGGGLETSQAVHRDYLDPCAKLLSLLLEPRLEHLFRSALDHVQQPRRPRLVAHWGEVDDHRHIAIAEPRVSPGMLIDADHGDTIKASRIIDQQSAPLLEHGCVRGVKRPYFVETSDLRNEDGVMVSSQGSGSPTARRYSPEEKAAAIRIVRTLRAEIGTEHGTVQRVATQLGYGVESVRTWVKQADIDEGVVPGESTTEAARLKELEQEVRELRRANEILRRAAVKSTRQCNSAWSLSAGVSKFSVFRGREFNRATTTLRSLWVRFFMLTPVGKY